MEIEQDEEEGESSICNEVEMIFEAMAAPNVEVILDLVLPQNLGSRGK